MAKGIKIEELVRQAERLKIQIGKFEATSNDISNRLNSLSNYLEHNPNLQENAKVLANRFSSGYNKMDENLKHVNNVMFKYIDEMKASDEKLRKAAEDFGDRFERGDVKNGGTTVFTSSNNSTVVGATGNPNGYTSGWQDINK